MKYFGHFPLIAEHQSVSIQQLSQQNSTHSEAYKWLKCDNISLYRISFSIF